MSALFSLLLQRQEEEDAITAADEKLADKSVKEEFKEAETLLKAGRASAFFASEGDLGSLSVPTRTCASFYMKKHTLSQRPYLHRHDFYELILVIRGTCRQNREISPLLHEGEACLIVPGAAHKIYKASAGDVILKAVIPPGLFARVCPVPVSETRIFTRFSAPLAIKLFCESCLGDIYKEQAEESLLRLLFIDMLRSRSSFPPLDEYLTAHLKDASLEDFARALGYSAAHTSRLVKSHTGETFSRAVERARIDRACALFMDGRTASGAGAEVGFRTQAGFHRCFLRLKGVTPSEYVRRFR